MKLKKITAALLAGAMVVSMAACGGAAPAAAPAPTGDAPAAEAPVEGEAAAPAEGEAAGPAALLPNLDAAGTTKSDETLVVALTSEPSYLWHPAMEGQMGTNEEQVISLAITDRLVKIDPATNEVLPMLATDWEWVDDTHLKFTIRDGVKTVSGATITADDVKYCVDLWAKNCATNDTGKFITGAEVDGNTVTIEYNVVCPDILRMMAWTNFGIVAEADVEANGGLEACNTAPVFGSGRYKFVEWKNGESITIERNEEYWDTDVNCYYKTIKFIFTGDPAARAMAVESGDAGIAVDMPTLQSATYVSNPAIKTYIWSYGQETHLWYNMGENAGPTKDLAVRQAIDAAIDFNALAQVATAGMSGAAMSYVSGAAAYSGPYDTVETKAADPELAKQLLADAGYTDEIELNAVCLGEAADTFTTIQAMLAPIGIKLNINNTDVPTFVQATLFDKDYDLVIVGDFLTLRLPTYPQFFDGGMVIGGPNTTLPELTDAAKAIMAETDESKLPDEVAALDELIAKDRVCSNLYDEMKACVTGVDVKGLITVERGYADVASLYK